MDITEYEETGQSLRTMKEKLNLMSSVTRHDILNQIMAVTGYLQLLHDMIPAGDGGGFIDGQGGTQSCREHGNARRSCNRDPTDFQKGGDGSLTMFYKDDGFGIPAEEKEDVLKKGKAATKDSASSS